jgi:hypothetical protein
MPLPDHVLVTLDRPLEQLSPPERRKLIKQFSVWLGVAKPTPPPLTKLRLDQRDAAIRAAARCYDGCVTAIAHKLANDLAKYLAAGFRREADLPELPEPASLKRRALHRIARIDARPIGERQMLNIIGSGHRGRLGHET